MVLSGIVAESERIELIAGEIVAMSPKGIHHETLRIELVNYWAERKAELYKFADETPLRLDQHNEPEPDIVIFSASERLFQVKGKTVLLAVEVADSSLHFDLATKSSVYALFGVREFWVINARTYVTTVHTSPVEGEYSDVKEVQPGQLLTPTLCRELAVRLADLDLAVDDEA